MGAWSVTEIRLSVRVKPGSSRARVGGSHDGALVVAVNAPPVDGAANEAVIRALAAAFGVKPGELRILSGHTSRTKVVGIETSEPEDIAARLAQLLEA